MVGNESILRRVENVCFRVVAVEGRMFPRRVENVFQSIFDWFCPLV